MIAKNVAILTAAVAVALTAIPASAQNAPDPDLRCATWALVASAQEKDEGKKRGLGFMMSYFMGRYEARTGGKIEAQINPKAIPALLGDVEDANTVCAPLAQGFGARLGETLNGLQPPRPATAPSNPAAGEGR
ncbi:hypothetical protein EKN06_04810 [Croceicoccus ponticola]|uniref:HNS-dependent expression A n=1 Tax=Croceicoccus ponticola TaxID=2217664 RepID=A0A437H1G8_9SPHN|nr:hypothetical protein [Croceicoccus ponticola]RVQ69494.1 hypothetical protein EKN06_04810 [Croceicoccus ponticola]